MVDGGQGVVLSPAIQDRLLPLDMNGLGYPSLEPVGLTAQDGDAVVVYGVSPVLHMVPD